MGVGVIAVPILAGLIVMIVDVDVFELEISIFGMNLLVRRIRILETLRLALFYRCTIDVPIITAPVMVSIN